MTRQEERKQHFAAKRARSESGVRQFKALGLKAGTGLVQGICHQPATSLPWTVEYPDLDNARITSRLQDVGEAKRNNDADFIVHAVNAYPKLVEALRQIQMLVPVNGLESEMGSKERKALYAIKRAAADTLHSFHEV